jgi:hypothetical protein
MSSAAQGLPNMVRGKAIYGLNPDNSLNSWDEHDSPRVEVNHAI